MNIFLRYLDICAFKLIIFIKFALQKIFLWRDTFKVVRQGNKLNLTFCSVFFSISDFFPIGLLNHFFKLWFSAFMKCIFTWLTSLKRMNLVLYVSYLYIQNYAFILKLSNGGANPFMEDQSCDSMSPDHP